MTARKANPFDRAPRAVQTRIASAMFDYSLIALAVHRNGLGEYEAALEHAALELESALAEGNRWIKGLPKK